MKNKENPAPHVCPSYSCGRPAFISHLWVSCTNLFCKHTDLKTSREYDEYVREQRLLAISDDDEEHTLPGFPYNFHQ